MGVATSTAATAVMGKKPTAKSASARIRITRRVRAALSSTRAMATAMTKTTTLVVISTAATAVVKTSKRPTAKSASVSKGNEHRSTVLSQGRDDCVRIFGSAAFIFYGWLQIF